MSHPERIITELLPVPSIEAGRTAIERAAAVIRRGGLVAFPTETVYGLGANALDAEAVAGIYRAKQRALDDPCIVHLADISDLTRVAAVVPPAAAACAAAFWPGPLSLVLPRTAAVPPIVTAGRATVAVRVPAHPVALALIRAAGVPVAAPSANTFMHTSPTTARHVWDDLAGRIDLILDGGPTPIGVESTVLDLSGPRPRLLRPGGVSLERLRAVLGEVEVVERRRTEANGGGEAAPGLYARHYAPDAELVLLDGPRAAVLAEAGRRLTALRAAGVPVGLLLTDADRAALGPVGADVPAASLGPGDARAVAGRLFAALRELEAAGVRVILARLLGGADLGAAVRDRLTRAAAGAVITVQEPAPNADG
jgi:L-threonylcarbamoyladenylate synthase